MALKEYRAKRDFSVSPEPAGAEPAKRKAGVKVPDAKALVDKLRNEAKVI